MSAEEVIDELNPIFREVLDNETISLSMETTAGDIDEWDSLANIQLVYAIEKRFAIRFDTNEIALWENVGDMVLTIVKRVP